MWLTDGRQSLLVEGERIARVEAGRRGRRFAALTPGLQDAHAHPLLWGRALRGLDLFGRSRPEEVAKRAFGLPPGAWVEGQGFLFPAPPPPGLLDRAAPENPVFLRSRDHHAAWINRRAAERAGLGPKTPAPVGGSFLRDGDGVPYYLLERAQELLCPHLPPPSPEDLARGLRTSPAGDTPPSTPWATSLRRPWTGPWGWSSP